MCDLATMIIWKTPWLLWLLFLVALPWLIAWLQRFRSPSILFPTIQWVVAIKAKQSHWRQRRHWMILLLRSILIGLMVIAFAQPSWLTQVPENLSASKAKVAVVYVIDNSASSGRRFGESTWLSVAKQAVEQALARRKRSGDLVCLMPTQALAQSAAASLTDDWTIVLRALREIQPTAHPADLSSAMVMARQKLEGVDEVTHREIVIVSDGQASDWQKVDLTRLASLKSRWPIRHTFLPVLPEPDDDNIAITEMTLRRHHLTVDQPAELLVTLSSYARQSRLVELTWTINDHQAGQLKQTVPSGQHLTIPVPITWPHAGAQRLTVTINDDALSVDNQAYGVVHVHEALKIAIIGSTSSTSSVRDGGYFIERALADSDRSVRFLNPASIKRGTLSAFDVVIIGQIDSWPDEAMGPLWHYVRSGGRVIFFCGQGPVDQYVKKLSSIAQASKQKLGWHVLPVQYLTDLSQRHWLQWPLVGDVLSRSILPIEQWQRLLRSISVHRRWQIQSTPSESRHRLFYDDGMPAITEQRLGRGQWLWVNISPDPTMSDLAQQIVFVPLMDQMLDWVLSSRRRHASVKIGQPIAWPGHRLVDESAPTSLIDPLGQRGYPQAVWSGQSLDYHYLATRWPGFYQWHHDGKQTAWSAVNMTDQESDLTHWAQQPPSFVMQRVMPVKQLSSTKTTELTTTQIHPLWPWLILLMIVLMLLEALLWLIDI